MVVRGIQNIRRKQMLIAYRREFLAEAVLSLRDNEQRGCKIEFSLEMTPLGANIVRVRFLEDLGYPLIPIMNEVKSKISEMDKAGTLPR